MQYQRTAVAWFKDQDMFSDVAVGQRFLYVLCNATAGSPCVAAVHTFVESLRQIRSIRPPVTNCKHVHNGLHGS